MMLWTKLLMEEQGYENIFYQDNKRAILFKKWPEERKKAISSTECSIFFNADQVNKGNIMVKYCR